MPLWCCTFSSSCSMQGVNFNTSYYVAIRLVLSEYLLKTDKFVSQSWVNDYGANAVETHIAINAAPKIAFNLMPMTTVLLMFFCSSGMGGMLHFLGWLWLVGRKWIVELNHQPIAQSNSQETARNVQHHQKLWNYTTGSFHLTAHYPACWIFRGWPDFTARYLVYPSTLDKSSL